MIRHYHGHLSAVYTLALHPTIDVLVSAGRDGTARVWDMRTKANVHTLTGHTDTVASLACQASEPQVIFYFLIFFIGWVDLLGELLWHSAGHKAFLDYTDHSLLVGFLYLPEQYFWSTLVLKQSSLMQYNKYTWWVEQLL